MLMLDIFAWLMRSLIPSNLVNEKADKPITRARDTVTYKRHHASNPIVCDYPIIIIVLYLLVLSSVSVHLIKICSWELFQSRKVRQFDGMLVMLMMECQPKHWLSGFGKVIKVFVSIQNFFTFTSYQHLLTSRLVPDYSTSKLDNVMVASKYIRQ